MAIAINGSTNVITGVAVGGLPDAIVDADMLASNAVTAGKLASGVGGKLVHYENIIWTGHASIGATTSRPELSSSLRFTYTPTSATNKIILRYNLRLSQGANFVTMFFVGKNVSNYSNMQNSEYVNAPATLVDPSFSGGDGGNAVVYGGNSTNGEMHQIALMAIETAGNTNQRIYSVHCKVTSNTAHFNRWTNNSYYGTSFAELFEVTP